MLDLSKEKLKFTLDLSKLDLTRLYVKADGTQTQLLEFECIATPGGKYGQTHFLTQRQTKDERLAKTRLPILGNLALAFPPKTGETHQSAPQGGPAPNSPGAPNRYAPPQTASEEPPPF
jgi:hypothetical protein